MRGPSCASFHTFRDEAALLTASYAGLRGCCVIAHAAWSVVEWELRAARC
jgi:hypothetical protein